MSEILTSLFLLLGTLTALIGAVGLVRFPDVYNRFHATGKNATLGIITILLAGVIYFSTHFGFTLKLLLVIPFLFWTGSAGVFMIGRAAHHTGTPLAKETIRNDLETRRGVVIPKE